MVTYYCVSIVRESYETRTPTHKRVNRVMWSVGYWRVVCHFGARSAIWIFVGISSDVSCSERNVSRKSRRHFITYLYPFAVNWKSNSGSGAVFRTNNVGCSFLDVSRARCCRRSFTIIEIGKSNAFYIGSYRADTTRCGINEILEKLD